ATACSGQEFTAATDDGGPGDPDATTGEGGGDEGGSTGDSSPFDAGPGFDAPPGPDTGPPLPEGGCGEVPIAGQGSFVSTKTSNKGDQPCASDTPCPTIQSGIEWAKANARTFVYVEQGIYTEQVNLADGITIRGGWERDGNGQWQIICDAGARVE